MSEWKHITVFDRPYPIEKQAEGMAVGQAVAEGHCDNCGFLKRCSTDDSLGTAERQEGSYNPRSHPVEDVWSRRSRLPPVRRICRDEKEKIT